MNSSPGLEGIERATNHDVAGAIVDYGETYAARNRKITRANIEQRIADVVKDERRGATKRGRR